MKMRHLLFSALIFASGVPAFGGIEELCFKNAGLKDEETVLLNIDESRVTGTYKIMREYSSDTVETFEFTGTRVGKTVKVKFKGNKLPSPSMKSLNWTLDDDGTKQTLRIKFNGKNHETNKSADYIADFEACEPSYSELKRRSGRLLPDPAGGTRKRTVKFATKDEHKAFRVNVPRGQTFGITAPMLNIVFYYPDGRRHAEPGIDSFASDILKKSGECLIVLKRYSTPDQESEEHAAEFTIEYSVGSEGR